MKKKLTIHSVDNGFCRINYKAKNNNNETIYYCLQDEGAAHGGVLCYRSTQDMEPSHQVKGNRELFEVPAGDSAIEKAVREYLTKED